FVFLHHIVSRDLRHLFGCSRLQRMRLVPFPIGALVVVIGAEECMKALRRMQHVVVRAACALIILVILSRRIELREFGIEFVIGDSARWRRSSVRCVEWKRRSPFEWRTQNRNGTENVRARKGGPGCDGGARVVTGDHCYVSMTERVD